MRFILKILFLLYSLTSFGQNVLLPIPPVKQQLPNWCWVTCIEMVSKQFNYPNQNPFGNYQCGIIGTLAQEGLIPQACANNCLICDGGSGTIRNGRGSNENMMIGFNTYSNYCRRNQRLNSYYEAAIRFNQLRDNEIIANLSNGLPIICAVNPSRRLPSSPINSEHGVVIIGYRRIFNNSNLIINDPFEYQRELNPYLLSGCRILAPYQYLVPISTFRNNLRWDASITFFRR